MKPRYLRTWSRVGLREQECDYRLRMIAETYSTVGRSLPLAWLNVWEKYGERLGGDWGEEGFAMGVLLQQQPCEAGLSSTQKVYELYLR